MSELPLVSVVVPTFNRVNSLRPLMDGLARQTYPRACFEVVVVDDGSTDGTQAYLRGLQPEFALRVLEQANAGPSEARNRGVASAQGSIIVFLDDDVVPAPELIAQHVETRQGDPDTAVIGPMNPPAGAARPAWIRWTETSLQRQYQALVTGEMPCTPHQFYTANASVPRASFMDLGGFDTRFKRNEDVELAFRLEQRGVRFRFNPAAEIVHYPTHSFEKWRDATYQYGRYDVITEREKRLPTLTRAVISFHTRNRLSRLVVHLGVGRPLVYHSLIWIMSALVRVADRPATGRIAMLALSGLSNLLYWQGISDELGGRKRVLAWLTQAATAAETR
jgi:glycosyltransferase involved in cell wall biosynthesis